MKTKTPRYPHVHVRLVGADGNAFAILGRTRRALQQGGVSHDVVNRFIKDAMSSNYDHLLQTVMDWVHVDGEETP